MFNPSSYDEADNPPATGGWTDTELCDKPKFGPQLVAWAKCQSGIMYYHSKLRIARISDGTSNTYLVGEKYLRADGYDGTSTVNGDGFDWGDNQPMYAGYDWDNQRTAWNPEHVAVKELFQPAPDTAGVPCGFPCRKFGSAHPGSFFMAFCDGSVHGINYDIDPELHHRLANRHDGKSVDLSGL